MVRFGMDMITTNPTKDPLIAVSLANIIETKDSKFAFGLASTVNNLLSDFAVTRRLPEAGNFFDLKLEVRGFILEFKEERF
jgi:hypothetical protein